MPLPSPIPHPRLSLDARVAIDRVVGSDWPEGDEHALRGLSDLWHEAAKLVGPALDDAGRAVSGAVAAFGGADSRQGEALQRLWGRTETTLSVETFEELGAMASAGARVIEAAKLEIYVQVTRMLAELEILAGLTSTTLGVSAACAEPVMLATRFAITGVLDRAVDELNELRSRAAAQAGLGQFSFGAPTLAEQLTTTTGGEGSAAADAVGGGDLVMAYGVGSLGAATGVAAMGGGGASRGTALRGRYGERALRGGRAADVLSAVTVNVITSDSAKWPGQLAPVAAEPVKLRQASREATEALSSLDNVKLASAEPAAAKATVGAPTAQATPAPQGFEPTHLAAPAAPPQPQAAKAPTPGPLGEGDAQRLVKTHAPKDATTARPAAHAADTQRTSTAVTRAATASGSFTLSALAQDPEPPRPEAPEAEAEPLLLLMHAQGRAQPADKQSVAEAEPDRPNEPGPNEYEELIAKAVADQRKSGLNSREFPPVHQRVLEASQPERFGDLRGDWLRLIDAGGPAADPARATHSVSVVRSVLDVWLRGQAGVAATGTRQKEIEEKLQRLRPDEQGLARVEAALRVEGHGSCAVIVPERTHGERHATTIHNRHGELFYVDAQRKVVPVATMAPPTAGIIRLEALAWTAAAEPIDLAGAPTISTG